MSNTEGSIRNKKINISNDSMIISKRPWYKASVVYQIYPWSFMDSNGDGIGDLQGIIKKLDYLNDGTKNSLGVGAIWLSPIYTSPMMDYGYDISNYYDIDSRFGTLADFDELVREAHKRGIKVIMDYVTSHTSSEHPWFTEAKSSKNNPKRDWYVWRDPKPDGSVPNNWLSVFGGPAWTLDKESGQYYLHHFLKDQPDLNWRNPEVREEMKAVLDFWMKRGVDGFRVDAISHFIEDSEFRDNPINERYVEGKDNPYMQFEHKYNVDQPELREVIELLCETLNNYDEKFVVTEMYSDLNKIVDMYRYSERKIHAPFNFNLMKMKWSAQAYRKFIDEFDRLLEKDEIPTYVLGNHDQPRLATRLDEHRARLSAMLILTLRGLPFIYYGEELGLKNTKIPLEKIKDNHVIQTSLKEKSRDPFRTPMQWSASPHAGFSFVEPWLPISRNYRTQNVETQEKDSHSMLNLYKTLIHYRNNSAALLDGTYKSINTSKKVYAYIREHEQERLLVVLNFSKDPITEILPLSAKLEVIASTYMDKKSGDMISDTSISLRPYEGCVYKLYTA